MRMKRLTALFAAAVMILSLAGCGSAKKPTLAGSVKDALTADAGTIEAEIVIGVGSERLILSVNGTVDRKDREFSLTFGTTFRQSSNGGDDHLSYYPSSFLANHRGDIATVTLHDGVLSVDLSGAIDGYRNIAEYLLLDEMRLFGFRVFESREDILKKLDASDLDDLERLTAIILYVQSPTQWDRDVDNTIEAIRNYPEDMDFIRAYVEDFEDAMNLTLADLLKADGFLMEVGAFGDEAKDALDTFTDVLVDLTAAAEEAAGEDLNIDIRQKLFAFEIDSNNVEEILNAVIEAAMEDLDEGWSAYAALCRWLRKDSAVYGHIHDLLTGTDRLFDDNMADDFEESWEYVLTEYASGGYKKDLRYRLEDIQDALEDVEDYMKDTRSSVTGSWSFAGKKGSRRGVLEAEMGGRDAEFTVSVTLTFTEDPSAAAETDAKLIDIPGTVKKFDWDAMEDLVRELQDLY